MNTNSEVDRDLTVEQVGDTIDKLVALALRQAAAIKLLRVRLERAEAEKELAISMLLMAETEEGT